jgi:isoamylase
MTAPDAGRPGIVAPLGAHLSAHGTHFAVAAEGASGVDLCLFSPTGSEDRWPMERDPGDPGVWRLTVAASVGGAGQRYGYRVHRPGGNPAKLLLDPYARRVVGELTWHAALDGANPQDSAPYLPKAAVIDPHFDWRGDAPPRTPWADTVVYEAHVKGLTRLHPEIPPPHRGTYLGLAAEPVLRHLRRLGVTAIQLMPVQHFISERFLVQQGRVNYWGYNPLAWFAPHAGYAVDDPVREFKTLVREVHRWGLEIFLDVVFNHTAEGGVGGPMLHCKGLDPEGYYRRTPEGGYRDFSGCGNTLDLDRPRARRLVLDALRYWVQEMHVDGFRFDLAPTLGRHGTGHGPEAPFDAAAPFFQELAADPCLAGTKWIAEPWDLGPGGYRLGDFPAPWAEWNDRYRDTIKAFWRGDPGHRGALASRLAGSRDLFPHRGPTASLNYITCHDGFTLRDLVSYRDKHNEANGEDNRDGHNHNLSDNFGVEGPTTDRSIRQRRRQRERTLLATLLLSQGVPMLSHGDEVGRSQQGNNNAYCQDGPSTWVPWRSASRRGPRAARERQRQLVFLRRVSALRRRLPPTRSKACDAVWMGTDGKTLTETDWAEATARQLAVALDGMLLLLNGAAETALFHLPPPGTGRRWRCLLDTASVGRQRDRKTDRRRTAPRRHHRAVAAGALVLLRAEAWAMKRPD